jgi:hypothetical protein
MTRRLVKAYRAIQQLYPLALPEYPIPKDAVLRPLKVGIDSDLLRDDRVIAVLTRYFGELPEPERQKAISPVLRLLVGSRAYFLARQGGGLRIDLEGKDAGISWWRRRKKKAVANTSPSQPQPG